MNVHNHQQLSRFSFLVILIAFGLTLLVQRQSRADNQSSQPTISQERQARLQEKKQITDELISAKDELHSALHPSGMAVVSVNSAEAVNNYNQIIAKLITMNIKTFELASEQTQAVSIVTDSDAEKVNTATQWLSYALWAGAAYYATTSSSNQSKGTKMLLFDLLGTNGSNTTQGKVQTVLKDKLQNIIVASFIINEIKSIAPQCNSLKSVGENVSKQFKNANTEEEKTAALQILIDYIDTVSRFYNITLENIVSDIKDKTGWDAVNQAQGPIPDSANMYTKKSLESFKTIANYYQEVILDFQDFQKLFAETKTDINKKLFTQPTEK